MSHQAGGEYRMRVMISAIVLVTLITLLLLILPRYRVRDEFYAVNRTHAALTTLAGLVQALDSKGVDVCDCKSVDDLLTLANRKGLWSDASLQNDWYRKDAWGMPLRLLFEDRGDESWAILVSYGFHHTPRSGDHDDIKVEVRLSKRCVHSHNR